MSQTSQVSQSAPYGVFRLFTRVAEVSRKCRGRLFGVTSGVLFERGDSMRLRLYDSVTSARYATSLFRRQAGDHPALVTALPATSSQLFLGRLCILAAMPWIDRLYFAGLVSPAVKPVVPQHLALRVRFPSQAPWSCLDPGLCHRLLGRPASMSWP